MAGCADRIDDQRLCDLRKTDQLRHERGCHVSPVQLENNRLQAELPLVRNGFRALLAIVLVSIPIGLVLAHVRAG